MKTTYTPGPWSLHQSTDTVYKSTPAGNLTICHDSGYDGCEAEANSKLIAAAPELLQSLVRILEWIDSECDPSAKSIEEARKAVKKALA